MTESEPLSSDDISSLRPGTGKPGIDEHSVAIVAVDDVAAAVQNLKEKIRGMKEVHPEDEWDEGWNQAIEEILAVPIDTSFAPAINDGGEEVSSSK